MHKVCSGWFNTCLAVISVEHVIFRPQTCRGTSRSKRGFDTATIAASLPHGDGRYTRAGNPKAPALESVLDWIYQSWDALSKDVIKKSFKCRSKFADEYRTVDDSLILACAITTAVDGSEDALITCFKEGNSIGPAGLEILRRTRIEEEARDGREDDEDAGLSEGEEEQTIIDDFNDDDDLFE